jgi:hypothetical protein
MFVADSPNTKDLFPSGKSHRSKPFDSKTLKTIIVSFWELLVDALQLGDMSPN